ncbi:MAG TPA: FAD binding domain-containing protein [Bradyrhizobium sp.]|jgi:xanthine dehydrogenase YagS FAD-binding subunit|nr:FAD binding domain-containing protein [Bradyrhizobium sp.]
MSIVSVTMPDAEFRAAGTDLSERRRSGVSSGPLLDIISTGDSGISWSVDGAATIGALTTIAAIAADARIAAAYPGIAASAKHLATPQIRRLATLGGNLAQRTRCWYFRNPHIACLKKGGDACPARSGNHLYGVAFDLGDCVAPHPSTMAAALLAYDAHIVTNRRDGVSITALLGDGSDGRRDHTLEAGEMIERIVLPPPLAAEHAVYKRAIGRTHAEWPLVEVCARTVVVDSKFQFVRLVAGGVAPVPLRLTACETALLGSAATTAAIAEAAKLAPSGANPLPMTNYKLQLLKGLVRDVLEQLTA